MSERGGRVKCMICGCPDLIPYLDVVDDTLSLLCPECEKEVAAAEILEAIVDVTISIDSVEDIDPQLRPLVQEHLEPRGGPT